MKTKTKTVEEKGNKDEPMDISDFLRSSFPSFLERPKRDEILVAAENREKHPWQPEYHQSEQPQFAINYGKLSEKVFYQGLKRIKRT